MPWVSPTNVATGDVLTATKWNNEVVANSVALRGDFGLFRRTAGNITLTGTTTWSDLTTIGTGGDITLAASTGDVIEVALNALIGSENVTMGFDVVTVVGSTKTNSISTGGAVPANFAAFTAAGWYRQGNALGGLSGSLFYVLQSGDISNSTVKLRVQYAMVAATNRTLYASSDTPFVFYARNHGPVEI